VTDQSSDATMPLGADDPFADVTSWGEEACRQWVHALNLRADAGDQMVLRGRLVELADLHPGDTAVEIGCGTGALLGDLAQAVGASGTAIGVEPQPSLADEAVKRLRARGHEANSEVRRESACRLSLESETAAACVAQSVLIHMPEDALHEALSEMVRVTRPNGRVISADQDGDTWVIDHPDRRLTRRIVRFNTDQRYADGWTGRRLLRLFRHAGLRHPEVHLATHQDVGGDSYLFGMAIRLAQASAAAGVISARERDSWIDRLTEIASQGDFFSSINYYVAVGVRA
jgi:ubiquinone/menaquinone biosynthesis C-methylase UbiE